MPTSDRDRLQHMLEAAQKAIQLTTDRTSAELKADDVRALALTHLGEAAKGVSEATKQKNAGIPWSDLAAVRDRLVHGYFSVDLDIVWEIATADLPAVLPMLEAALRDA